MAKVPKYSVHIRWGGFCLDLVGRRLIIGLAAFGAALVGLKIFLFHF